MFYSLRFVAGNMDVNTLAGVQTFPVDLKHGDCSKALRNPQKVNLCVLASFSLRGNAGTQGSTCGRLGAYITIICNAFCSYFTNAGQQCASSIGQATTHSSSYLKGNYQNSLFLTPTTPGDTIAIISSFKSKASSGHDGVSSKLFKDLKYALSFPLSVIINNSLTMGLVPNMAKLAKIIPIYKAKDKKNISNYRPISLLPVISKILEKVVHKNL